MYYFYLAHCNDGSLYAGYCADLKEREKRHNQGKGSKYTRSRLPVKFVYHEEFETQQEALEREAQVKGWRREKKEELINRSN